MNKRELWATLKLEKCFIKHGLIKMGWKYKFNNNKSCCGVCKYHSKTIELSRNYINSKVTHKRDIKDTILHEIAHALCPGEQHNTVWKTKAIEIGCNGKRCSKGNFNTEKDYKWLLKCSNGCCIKRHKLIKRFKLHRLTCKNHKLPITIIQQF